MPFHSARANMAALLRSARLLRISPSGLRHITGTNRTGSTPCLFYSGTPSRTRNGVLSRFIGPALRNGPSSAVWTSPVGCGRSYAVAADEREDASSALLSQQFDLSLTRLDTSVRKTGRITKTLLLSIFHDICKTGYPSGNLALLLLRSCGSLLPEVPLDQRTALAHQVWEKLQGLGVKFDVSHYNALLKVYLQNEFQFSPSDFLDKMGEANVQPNRVTYQRLIAAYCQTGDMEGASTILGFMKTKDLPITEAVFNSLVTGHSRAGDIEGAKNILSVMRTAGLEPSPDTYVSLLSAYAEHGDLDSLKTTMAEAESADCEFTHRDMAQVIHSMVRAGHQQHVPHLVEHFKSSHGSLPDTMNLCLSLVTQGHHDTSFHILKTFCTQADDTLRRDSILLSSLFLKHCVNVDLPLTTIQGYCQELGDTGMHTSALTFALSCALEAKKTDVSMEMMKLMKEQDLPIRPHYFCPLLVQTLKDKNVAGMVEVLKKMQDLGLSPDADMLYTFILPLFPNRNAARKALMDTGVLGDCKAILAVDVPSMAMNNLAELYDLLSDPSSPPVNHNTFRAGLIQGFRGSDDVESMVKLTELIYRDDRFTRPNSDPAETTSYFLYNFFERMTEEEVHQNKDKLRKYLKMLRAQNINIPTNIYRGIKTLLEKYHVPELTKDVMALVDQQEAAAALTDPKVLEQKLVQLKAANKPFGRTLYRTIVVLCEEENLQQALQLKQQHEDQMTAEIYSVLIRACSRHDDHLEVALKLKKEIDQKDPSMVLEASAYLSLVRVLSKDGRVEGALDVLTEMKQKEVVLNKTHSSLFHTLNSLVTKGEAPVIQQLLDTIVTLGLAKPSSSLCAPLVTVYLNRKDLSGALDMAMQCQERYQVFPRVHDVLVGLIENGEKELLQKAIEFATERRGEMNALYDLLFAFLDAGQYKEARKIVETPGLRAKSSRLQWFAEKCIVNNKVEALEQMVDMTSKLFECDRDEMFSYLLRLYGKSNNWEKAEGVWLKMQEDTVIPRERTLRLLADILKANGQEVPFEVPETWYEERSTAEHLKAEPTRSSVEDEAQTKMKQEFSEDTAKFQAHLLSLCRKGKAKEAFEILKQRSGETLSSSCYDQLICGLLSKGKYEDAMEVKDIASSHIPDFSLTNVSNSLLIVTLSKKDLVEDALDLLRSMVQMDMEPSQLSISSLVQAQGRRGDLAAIQEVESLMGSSGINMTFVNNKAMAHTKNGDLDSAVDLLESVCTSPDSNPRLYTAFQRILDVGDDKALDKLSVLTERLANHFSCYRPITDLFVLLLDQGRVDEATFMLNRCPALAEQKDWMFSNITSKALNRGKPTTILHLLNLIPDFTDEEKEKLFTYLMKYHVLEKDLSSAKSVFEQMKAEKVTVNELTLKRLASLYTEAGETPPFTEPPMSYRFYADKLKDKSSSIVELTTEE
ncbi:leucine-rich PPR motif-containing protein, mitochondrial [Cynoglossus semilaevis]|uniref:leucine-rich PPR motif-containing protein, mitochondrial n=1 Tax=Cynoglossus semilaevis TaxID=244447 RepID=UPI0004972F58|nr:leucine-rich PPR motif-containing protein, mitochondrial [Cynoglossus semilaevis]